MNNKMMPNMGSQPAAKFVSGGLPVCLSGIGIRTRLEITNRYPRLQLRHETTRRCTYGRKNSIPESERHLVEMARAKRLQELSLSESFTQGRPRDALYLQMADIDRRREALIRNRRSTRAIWNLEAYERSVLGQRNENRVNPAIRAVMQLPSLQHEFARESMCHRCAKAA